LEVIWHGVARIQEVGIPLMPSIAPFHNREGCMKGILSVSRGPQKCIWKIYKRRQKSRGQVNMVDEHNINIMIYFTERSRSKYMYTVHLRHERVSARG
jgi:hypothetical protein